MHRLVAIAGAAIILGSVGCGPPPPPDAATMKLDRDSIGFNQEFGSGTFIGTKVQNSLQVQNIGQADLVITSITLTGDPEFTMQTMQPPLTVRGLKSTFITVFFEPKAVKTYAGNITIVSNDAVDAGVKVVGVSGRGINPADAGNP